ncbi:MAG: hypothetical protein GW778_03710 [Alphaproteobacteria bacterium]|nr:hypothetical protein [Alphaproteobacteria bacterium]
MTTGVMVGKHNKLTIAVTHHFLLMLLRRVFDRIKLDIVSVKKNDKANTAITIAIIS